jgi:hypothetical protein
MASGERTRGGKTSKGRATSEKLEQARRKSLALLRERATQLEAFEAEVGDVFRRVDRLNQRAAALGIATPGYQASGPHLLGSPPGDDGASAGLSRDVSTGLFVAWRALQATVAFVRYGGDSWREFRSQIRGARNVFRGGRPDASPSADRRMAVGMARQAIGFALGIGWQGRTEDDGVAHIRQSYAELFGDVFKRAPVDTSIRAHLNATSRAGLALAKWRCGATLRDAFDEELELAVVALAVDVLWRGYQAAGESPGESCFRFPMDRKDTTQAKLRTRFLSGRRDGRRKARKTM